MKIKQLQLEHEIFSNCYLLVDEESGEAAIVDPAWYGDVVKNALDGENITLKYVLLTHGHFDHIFGVYGLQTERGAKVVIHSKDAGHLLDPKKSLAESNFPEKQYPVIADILIKDGDVLLMDGALEGLSHQFGGVGASAGGAAIRVMVGLVADVLAKLVGGEGHTQLRQVEESTGKDGD